MTAAKNHVALITLRPLYPARRNAAAFLSVSETMLDQLVANGDAPKPRKLSAGRVAWLTEELEAWGFPEAYAIDQGADGRPLTKTAQVRMCGNSVSPPLLQAIVATNYTEPGVMRRAA